MERRGRIDTQFPATWRLSSAPAQIPLRALNGRVHFASLRRLQSWELEPLVRFVLGCLIMRVLNCSAILIATDLYHDLRSGVFLVQIFG